MPNHDPIAVAKDYVETHGQRLGVAPLDGRPSTIKINPELSKAAGLAYERMKDSPHDPKTAEAYKALQQEVLLQFAHMVKHGMKIEAWRKDGQPYANSKEMQADVQDNAHLWYFPSDAGFGKEGDTASNQPLMEKVPGTDMPYNDLFRAVHDYYAHATHGHQFGPVGEQRAWHEHSKMFSKLAKRALTTETHGQNSWVNFGPHEPWNVPITQRPYAEQKTGLLPEEVWPNVGSDNQHDGQPGAGTGGSSG